MAKPIIVVEYDPTWPDTFESLKKRVAQALGDVAVAIEHVGSTSVPGLAAKPIIDMDVVVPTSGDVPTAIERLADIGYIHQGNLGIEGREAFIAPPNTPDHHLYVCPQDSRELRRHVRFRDYLRRHPDAAKRYADLKRLLAERHRDDRGAYTQAKTEFITEILRIAEEEDAGLSQ